MLKSVLSTLNHLQSPPEQMQSQHNSGSFLSKSHLHGMILFTKLAQNRPKSGRQWFNRAICYFLIVNIKQGEATVSDHLASVNTENSFALKEKKAYHSH